MTNLICRGHFSHKYDAQLQALHVTDAVAKMAKLHVCYSYIAKLPFVAKEELEFLDTDFYQQVCKCSCKVFMACWR